MVGAVAFVLIPVGSAFGVKGITEAIRKKGNAALADQVYALYEDLIDKGAHPNIDAFAKSFVEDYSPGEEALIFGNAFFLA